MSAVVRFLAPLAVVIAIVPTLRADDEPKPTAYLGVKLKPAEDGKGFAVDGVNEDSPANKAGIKPEDVILKLDGKEVGELDDFVQHVRKSKPGDKLTLTIKRDGKEQEIKVTLGTPPKMDN
jgi:S1-C subfamily serine protease